MIVMFYRGGQYDIYFPYLQVTGQFALMLAAVVGAISAWRVAKRMRQRIQEDTGKQVSEGDLTSIETWMKVDEVEQKKHPGQEWAPESDPDDGSRGL